MVLLQDFPVSAVATERMALVVRVLMAFEAQTLRYFVNRAWEVPETAVARARLTK